MMRRERQRRVLGKSDAVVISFEHTQCRASFLYTMQEYDSLVVLNYYLYHSIYSQSRDWAQIPIVLNDMADSWSGFIAYTYDGPQDFTMFAGGPWDGKHILTPTKDFDNFQYQLNQVANVRPNVTFDNGYEFLPRHCGDVEADLLSCCDVRLFSNNKMPSYANMIDPKTGRPTNHNMWLTMAAFLIALGVTAWIQGRSRSKRNLMEGISLLSSHNGDGYKSFPR